MRGAAISPSADILRSSSARGVGLPTSRMVVMPQASQMLSSYSIGCALSGALFLQVRVVVDQAGQHVLRLSRRSRRRLARWRAGSPAGSGCFRPQYRVVRGPGCRCRRPPWHCGSAGGGLAVRCAVAVSERWRPALRRQRISRRKDPRGGKSWGDYRTGRRRGQRAQAPASFAAAVAISF